MNSINALKSICDKTIILTELIIYSDKSQVLLFALVCASIFVIILNFIAGYLAKGTCFHLPYGT